MSKPRVLGLLGAILLAIGVYLPAISLPSGDVTYVASARNESYVLLGLAALALILALVNRTRLIWISGVGAIGVLGYNFFTTRETLSTAVSRHADSLAVIQGSAEASASFHWGWGVLLLGTILLIAASAMSDDRE